jgi:hypothetical protein
VKLPVAAGLSKANPGSRRLPLQVINSGKDLLLRLSARLVADIGLTYKIGLRNQLTIQPGLLSEASSGRNA